MASAEFKGSITTTGRSEAIRLDKALFKAHPEFKQRAKVHAHVIGPGSLLVTLDGSDDADEGVAEHDPVAAAYLAFIEKDMIAHPERLRPFSEDEVERIKALTHGVAVSDDDIIPDDITL